MEPFALVFMLVSMVSVTALAGYCMFRILGNNPGPPEGDDETEPPAG